MWGSYPGGRLMDSPNSLDIANGKVCCKCHMELQSGPTGDKTRCYSCSITGEVVKRQKLKKESDQIRKKLWVDVYIAAYTLKDSGLSFNSSVATTHATRSLEEYDKTFYPEPEDE